jgi:hypothetical protein
LVITFHGALRSQRAYASKVDDEALPAATRQKRTVGEALDRLHFADQGRPLIAVDAGDAGELAPCPACDLLEAAIDVLHEPPLLRPASGTAAPRNYPV